jgi:hypothetical protein
MKQRIIGIIFIALGLLLALGPQFLFKVCEPMGGSQPTMHNSQPAMDGGQPAMGDMFMKCHWSAQAEIGIGAVIAAFGIALIIFTCVKIRLGFVIGILLSGIHALLIPHVLIGGCLMDSMPCRKIAFPAITVISILLLIGAGIYTIYLARRIKNSGDLKENN